VNVTCDKCNKRYAIADEKVVGKSVKIRCKQCQNLISVNGPGVAAAPAPQISVAKVAAPNPWEDERTRAVPAQDFSPVWFAMVKGKQLGPLSLKDLDGKVKAGEVSLRTYLWKQGMGDWKRASDVPEVAPVFAGVSVGASATGPVQSAQKKTTTRQMGAVSKDVATANEVPSPEVTRSKGGAKTNGNGNGHSDIDPYERDARTQIAQPFPTAPETPRAKTSKQTAVSPSHQAQGFEDPAPARAKTGRTGVQPAVQAPAPAARKTGTQPKVETKAEPRLETHGSLNDLFADVPAPSGTHNKPELDLPTDPNNQAAQSLGEREKADPFAALGDIQPGDLPPPGEATKFFIAQAGVNKRNPPWKIALFVLCILGLPIGVLYLLSTLHVVPPVLVTNEKGEVVEQSFFTPEGFSVGIKDLLSGETKKKQREAEARARAEALAMARKNQPQKPIDDPTALPGRKDGTRKFSETDLKDLYGAGGPKGSDVTLGAKSDVGPKNRLENSAPIVEKGGGLDPDVVSKVMGERMKGLQGCVEDALKRNPNVRLEKATLVLEVGTSGAVKGSGLEPKRLELTDWGGCIRDRARKITFPASDGETQVQIPLLLAASVQ
jgi:predicted Zn finger-like uncharacterized protein